MNISENLALMRMAGKKRKIKHFKAKDSVGEFLQYEREIINGVWLKSYLNHHWIIESQFGVVGIAQTLLRWLVGGQWNFRGDLLELSIIPGFPNQMPECLFFTPFLLLRHLRQECSRIMPCLDDDPMFAHLPTVDIFLLLEIHQQWNMHSKWWHLFQCHGLEPWILHGRNDSIVGDQFGQSIRWKCTNASPQLPIWFPCDEEWNFCIGQIFRILRFRFLLENCKQGIEAQLAMPFSGWNWVHKSNYIHNQH